METITNTILNCDCVDGMKKLPANCIDLTVTSPPYDEIRTCFNLLPLPKFKEVAQELLRITKPGGIVAWVVQEQFKNGSLSGTGSEHRLYFRNIGFFLHNDIILSRYATRVPLKNCYGLPLEQAIIVSKGKPSVVNLWNDKPNKNAGRSKTAHRRLPNGQKEKRKQTWIIAEYGRRGNVWSYPTGVHVAKEAWVREAKDHGAIMPEQIAEDLILSYSKPDALVFDPFCGFCTTPKMALLNHRQYLGMEDNAGFHELGIRRMKEAQDEYERRLDAWLKRA